MDRKSFCGHKEDRNVVATFEDQLRKKRATSGTNGTVCLMHLVADHRFFSIWGRNVISNTIISLVIKI